MIETEGKISLHVINKLKHTKAGTHQRPLELLAFPHDKTICIVRHIRLYPELTQELRGEENPLLISFTKPYKTVSCDTISHWVRSFMKAAGQAGIRVGHATRIHTTVADSNLRCRYVGALLL